MKTHQLVANALCTCNAPAGTRIKVESGIIWFTAAGADIVLGRGHDYQLAMDEELLIQAMTDSRFSVDTRQLAHTQPYTQRLKNWLPRLSLG
ncbi:DUF2917 domain-containing protein [Chitinimonas naiadis]